MKKIITLLLALLFILTACAPAVVEQTPAPKSTPEPTVEATPEPTEEADKPTVIVVLSDYLISMDDNIPINSAIEEYCTVNGFDYYLINFPDFADFEGDEEKYQAKYNEALDKLEELFITRKNAITVYNRGISNDCIELNIKHNVKSILFDTSTTYYKYAFRDDGMILPTKHYVSYDKKAFVEYIYTELARACDGKNSIIFESRTQMDSNSSFSELIYDTKKKFEEDYDMADTETITIRFDNEYFDLSNSGIQEAYWKQYFSNVDVNAEQICLFSLRGEEEWYLDQLYKLGLTDEQIFHLDYGIANEANIKKMTDGKSDVFYGYTEEAMHKLLISTIDRIFAGETVEERLYVEPIILTSKEEAQAYYDEHFA